MLFLLSAYRSSRNRFSCLPPSQIMQIYWYHFIRWTGILTDVDYLQANGLTALNINRHTEM